MELKESKGKCMAFSKSFKALIAALFFCLVLASCGESNEGASQTPDTPEVEPTEQPTPIVVPTPTPSGEVDNLDIQTKPLVVIPDSPPPSTLQIDDIVIGQGPQVLSGDFLIMDYVGVSYSTGLQFDASWDRGQPFPFELGAGRVIKGWDEGIAGMAVGGRRTLTIPPELAYGETGSGSGSIGPNETLVFTVDLLASVPQSLKKPTVEVQEVAPEGLTFEDAILGSGSTVIPGSILYIHYVGVAQSSGEQFDSSWDRGRSEFIGFISGAGNVIEGLDQGMIGMKVGGRRTIVIPSSLAYGENGAGNGLIAPNETLIFTVDLLGIASTR